MLQTDRREFVRTLLTGAAGLTLTWRSAAAQGRGPAPITATKITDRIVALSGNGGNVGVVIGPDGLVMIDGGLAPRAADLAKAIAEISPRMVQVLFNTHYHFDHVGSNEYLGKQRVRIIAHENVKKRLGTTFENPAMGRTMEALPAVALPTETFAASGRLEFGPEIIQYTHTPTAHTDGDAFVFFANSNVIHTGDLLLGRPLPGRGLQRGRVARAHGGCARADGQSRRRQHEDHLGARQREQHQGRDAPGPAHLGGDQQPARGVREAGADGRRGCRRSADEGLRRSIRKPDGVPAPGLRRRARAAERALIASEMTKLASTAAELEATPWRRVGAAFTDGAATRARPREVPTI